MQTDRFHQCPAPFPNKSGQVPTVMHSPDFDNCKHQNSNAEKTPTAQADGSIFFYPCLRLMYSTTISESQPVINAPTINTSGIFVPATMKPRQMPGNTACDCVTDQRAFIWERERANNGGAGGSVTTPAQRTGCLDLQTKSSPVSSYSFSRCGKLSPNQVAYIRQGEFATISFLKVLLRKCFSR